MLCGPTYEFQNYGWPSFGLHRSSGLLKCHALTKRLETFSVRTVISISMDAECSDFLLTDLRVSI
jgi:hypothetical protein